MTRLVALVVLVALVMPACGRKSPPQPPEAVAPQPITDLAATNTADGIVLSWSRPRKHADGAPLTALGGFTIQRAGAASPSRFQMIATVQLDDRERFQQQRRFRYLDRDPTDGAQYLYRVISFTDDGYRSEVSNLVAVMREIPPPATNDRAKSTPRAVR
jgi:hypothetical protein